MAVRSCYTTATSSRRRWRGCGACRRSPTAGSESCATRIVHRRNGSRWNTCARSSARWAYRLTASYGSTSLAPSASVIVPGPAIEEQSFIHRSLDDVAYAVARRLGVRSEARTDRPIYLSKTRLSGGISRMRDERLLEDALAARGFHVVHPQELSFADQVRTIARASAVTGTLGSALHSTMFLTSPSRVVRACAAEHDQLELPVARPSQGQRQSLPLSGRGARAEPLRARVP